MDKLPLELRSVIAGNLSYFQILNFCQATGSCQDKKFWQMLISQKYPGRTKDKLYESNPEQLFRQLDLKYGYYLVLPDGNSLYLINKAPEELTSFTFADNIKNHYLILEQLGIGAGYLIIEQFDPDVKIIKSTGDENVADLFVEEGKGVFYTRNEVKNDLLRIKNFSFGVVTFLDGDDVEHEYFIDKTRFYLPSFLKMLDKMLTFAGFEPYYYLISSRDTQKKTVELQEVTPDLEVKSTGSATFSEVIDRN